MHQCGSLDEARITELFGRGWPDALHRVIPNADRIAELTDVRPAAELVASLTP